MAGRGSDRCWTPRSAKLKALFSMSGLQSPVNDTTLAALWTTLTIRDKKIKIKR